MRFPSPFQRSLPARARRRPALSLEPLEDRSCPAVNIAFDYSLDTSGFFNNPQARTVLQEAGQLLGAQLNDALSAIVPGGSNQWSAGITDPSTGAPVQLNNLTIPSNTILVYAGGRYTGGSTLGEGGPGSLNVSGSPDWLNTVLGRGQAGALAATKTDFGPWGGSVYFDTSTNWFFGDTTSSPASYQYDFLTAATHELGHVLGIGTAQSWQALAFAGSFHGPAAVAAYGVYPPVDAAGQHWAAGVRSGETEAVMTPSIQPGQRKLFTPLDWAGLRDIGWQVTSPAPSTTDGVFVVGTDGQVHVQRLDAAGNPSGVYTLVAPGQVRAVSAGHQANGNQELFVLGLDYQVYGLRLDAAGNATGGYFLVAPGYVRALSAGHDAANNPELFVVGLDNQAWGHKLDAWGSPLGGYFLAASGRVQSVSAGNSANGNPLLFVIGMDNQVYAQWLDAGGNPTSGYHLVASGGVLSVSAGHDAANNPELFVIGMDGQVWAHKLDIWGNALGGYFLTAPGVVRSLSVGNDPSGSPELFVTGLDYQVYAEHFDRSGNSYGAYFSTQPGTAWALTAVG